MANKDSSAKKIDLSAVKKINFAKLKRLKAVNICLLYTSDAADE